VTFKVAFSILLQCSNYCFSCLLFILPLRCKRHLHPVYPSSWPSSTNFCETENGKRSKLAEIFPMTRSWCIFNVIITHLCVSQRVDFLMLYHGLDLTVTVELITNKKIIILCAMALYAIMSGIFGKVMKLSILSAYKKENHKTF